MSDALRNECWFLQCSQEPAGDLYGSDGDSVAACEKHGVAGESYGWERFVRYNNADADDE